MKVKDGWHTIKKYNVYVENGRIIRGTLGQGKNAITAYPYKFVRKLKAYVKGTPSVSAFRKKKKKSPWFLW